MTTLPASRGLIALTALVVAVSASSCLDKTEATPTGGTIQGEINIAGATNAVTLSSVDGQTASVVPDAATGKFVFRQVVPGAYTLTALPAGGYHVPSPFSLTVKAGETAAAKLVFNRDHSMVGTMSWEQNGVMYTATHFRGSFSSSSLNVTGTTEPLPEGGTREVTLVIPADGTGNVAPFQGVGTYPLGLAHSPYAWGFYYLDRSFDQYWSDYSNRRVGQIQVARFVGKENVARGTAVAGTFEFVALLALNTTGKSTPTMDVTNGKFDLTY